MGSIHSARLTSNTDSLLNDFLAFMLKSPFHFLDFKMIYVFRLYFQQQVRHGC